MSEDKRNLSPTEGDPLIIDDTKPTYQPMDWDNYFAEIEHQREQLARARRKRSILHTFLTEMGKPQKGDPALGGGQPMWTLWLAIIIVIIYAL